MSFKMKNMNPVTENERSSYKLDLTFIYDAFQNSWADSMNFYMVEQNKPTKNGAIGAIKVGLFIFVSVNEMSMRD